MDFYKGELILINKPSGWTSFDVVNKLRNILIKISIPEFLPGAVESNLQPVKTPRPVSQVTRKLKVGHAGTLDPLATGLLIICTGKLTKEISQYREQEKEYTGIFFLGAATPSFDLETMPVKEFPVSHITNKLIVETAKKFTGKIIQVPPVYSAKKIAGERAYKNARKGLEVKMTASEIFIHEFEITKIEMPLVRFRIVCSKGTYIRAVADDFGKALNSGAYLASLCRTRIGKFKLEDALSIEEFQKKYQVQD